MRLKVDVLYLFFVLAFFFSLYQPSHAGEVVVRAEADKKEAHIAERIVYTLDVEADEDTPIMLPVDRPDFRPFELLGMQAADREVVDGRVKYHLEFVITAYTTGELTVPPLPVYYIDISGKEKEILTESVKISIRSTVPPTEVDIKDVRGLVGEDRVTGPYQWRVLAGIGAILILVGGMVYLYIMGKRSSRTIIEETIDPRNKALRELEGIRRESFDDIREYYRTVSDVVKRFLLDGTPVPEAGLTNREFLDIIRKKKDRGVAEIENFVTDCYMVRFARYSPTDDEVQKYLEEAKRIVSIF